MGLEQVVQEVQRAADREANAARTDAAAQAEAILKDAKAEVEQYRTSTMAVAQREAEQARAQVMSSAEFGARKVVLETEAYLRDELWHTLSEGFANLPKDVRSNHLDALRNKALGIIPDAKFLVAEQDAKNASFDVAGTTKITGGLIAESPDGKLRVDLSYDTLLRDAWRDILKQEAKLFS